MRISIFGLGYVGAVSAACLARDGHQVVGVDVDDSKLRLIREGRSPVIEEGIGDLMNSVVDSGRLRVSADVSMAVENTDISFICVGTPSLANGGQDLGAMKRVSEQMGDALRAKTAFHTFVVRSTVIPGTVEEDVIPILEERSGKRAAVEFGVCFQPEFLREGSSIKDYDNPPYTVVGGTDKRSVGVLRELFGGLPSAFLSCSIRTAEMLKYCSNSFHALKISFANEIGRIAQAIDVDSQAVMELLCRDTRLNISPAYLKPGFAFGGSCLPKDLRATLKLAQDHNVQVPVLSGILPSNQMHIEHAVSIVLGAETRKVGLIGLSFKSGTDDLRESPLVTMAERLIGKGVNLAIYDPEVSVARLIGANRDYIERTIPHIASLMVTNIQEAVRSGDVVILARNEPEIQADVLKNLKEGQILLDFVGIGQRSDLKAEYIGVCW